MTGRQRKRSEVAYCSLRYACTSFARLFDKVWRKIREGILVDCKFFSTVVGRFLYTVRWQLPLEFYSLIIQSSRVFAFSYFRYCNNYCRTLWSVCICVCLCMCASVASIRVEIVSGGKKSEMDADYAAILTN